MTRVHKLLLGIVLGLVVTGALGSVAAAQEDDGEDTEATEFVSGTLTDRKGTADRADDEPVPDAEITITTAGGDEIGECPERLDVGFGPDPAAHREPPQGPP